jgi:hypothetical protein
LAQLSLGQGDCKVRYRIIILAVIFIIFTMLSAFGEDNTPEPYDKDKIPKWLMKLRRAEIILLGAMPITFFVSYFTYDIIRYGIHGWDKAYKPFGNPNRIPLTLKENVGVIIAASCLSLTIVLIDLIIGKIKERRLKKNEESSFQGTE